MSEDKRYKNKTILLLAGNSYLNHNTIPESSLRVDLTDFSMAVPEVEPLNHLMNLSLTNHRLGLPVWGVQATMDKGGVVVVESRTKK